MGISAGVAVVHRLSGAGGAFAADGVARQLRDRGLSDASPQTHLNERSNGPRFGERVVACFGIVLARFGDKGKDVYADFGRSDAIFAGESRVGRGAFGDCPIFLDKDISMCA